MKRIALAFFAAVFTSIVVAPALAEGQSLTSPDKIKQFWEIQTERSGGG